MFCQACTKLAILFTNRTCVRCQGNITNNISCICDKCSNEQNICSCCLKKMINLNIKKPSGGCKSCGGG